ncbi:hypothetical protein [Mangrovimonas sp. YM274]|uniref:hypothetical protein n=1 Tax=Mangrovimonas sp. YM274 TaxID=3070660 RepID=UPI0027DE39C9|nr:hypothetical protein [Mangrovimonas sp. YM274]WMI70164.1 hypothetical protein RBH95_07385 [Mangrovimonas sp. YM274]
MQLKLPQTEVSNKSKTTLSNAHCSSYTTDFKIASSTKVSKKYTPDLEHGNTSSFTSSVALQNKPLTLGYTLTHSIYGVPLYILYRNFKDYI